MIKCSNCDFENSYGFIRRHNIIAGDSIPKGYRAVWKDRYKLAVAKLMEKILLTKETNYAIIILNSPGDRKRDEFIEVHIYGKINKEAIRAVRGNSKVDPGQKAKILQIKEYLKINKKEWIEE